MKSKRMGVFSSKFKDEQLAATSTSTTPGRPTVYQASTKTTSVPSIGGESVNEGLAPSIEAGKYIALDCEMVGVGPNPDRDSALARVSVVNYHGMQLYDSFVLPKEAVTDFRTAVSGITPDLLRSARTLEVVQADIVGLIDGKVLVGHAIRNDLDALMLGHPKRDIRDTSSHPGYRQLVNGRTPSLKMLARELLGVEIQGGKHSSVEDARVTMMLFRREKDGFEEEHRRRWGAGRQVVVGDGNGEVSKTAKKGKKKRKSRR